MPASRPDMQTLLAQHDMVFEAAPRQWEQGMLLGNGNLGAVIWGDGASLHITLNRMEAWDRRGSLDFGPDGNYRSLRKLLDAGRVEEAAERYNTHQEIPYPTPLFVGELRLDFGSNPRSFEGRLDLLRARATGTAITADGKTRFSGFVHAQKNLLVLEADLEGGATFACTPDLECLHGFKPRPSEESADIRKAWGYPDAETGHEGELSWHVQRIPDSGAWCVMWVVREDPQSRRFTMWVGVELDTDGDPLPAARNRMDEALASGGSVLEQEHETWWRAFWDRSALTIPDARLENLYYAELYKLACNTIGRLPVTGQGVWIAGGPDYHLNLNVQESYWPIYTSNHLELGKSLYDVFFEMLPRFRKFCRDFYGWDGAMALGALAPNGAAVPCPFQWSFWTGSGPWVAHHFWLHYLYSRDEDFLRCRAYPFMRAFMQFYVGYLESGEDGRYHLPWDSSPEFEYRMGRDVTCSLALVRFLAEALLQSQDILEITDPDAPTWRDILDHLAPFPEDRTGLMIMKDTPLSHTHRHHSHLMPIHPLGQLDVDGNEQERSLIRRSINTWLRQGFGEWIGEVWPWASLIASRIRKGNMAWMFLDRYANAFPSENSLNMNNDEREYGEGGFFFLHPAGRAPAGWPDRWPREPTLNGGFGAAAAMLEMLLQSWTGVMRVFPAIPDRWHDAWFENLRAEGAFIVSSRLAACRVKFIDITSEVGGTCRVHNPWPTRAAVTHLASQETRLLEGSTLEVATRRGDRLRFTAEGVTISEDERHPPEFNRGAGQCNWFGVKKAPRF